MYAEVMVRATWLVTGVVGALALGCVESSVVPCGEDKVCPGGTTCDPSGSGRCLRPEQVAACETVADGESCMIDSRQGTCRNSACELWACGDGYVNANEDCDGVDLGGATCLDVGFYAAGGLACDRDCQFDPRECGGGSCGDDIINGRELCDGPTSKACILIGYDAGTVGCNDITCSLTITNCSRFGWDPEGLTDVVALAVAG